ncbi:TPR domain-containing protein [Metarhizium robertsii ARSEF 23]|uniref:TPR domain-containing protein n=1 Tax=Metarhizium robertsii (strain ARSEF 23 / ATCC MYA-3075) TaxID=655844 RepID=E9F3E3_METRA|nr:TPR domain-containing protein [Metarhizium robertsii ARSEF 23]EFY97680.1 TPR domain-containing protein [Metarhizium robertsii ARSEF 23]
MATPHAIMCESFFNLDKEIIVYLNGCHDSDLLSMEKLHEKLEIFEGMRLHIITCLLLYLRTGATVHAEKALHRARRLNTMAGPGDKDEAGKILETAVIMKDNGRNLVQSLTLNEIRRQLKTRLEESGLLTAPAPGVYAVCQCFQPTPQDDSTWVPSLLGLAGVFKKRFEQSTPRDIRDLNLAINLALVGLRATPENDGLYRSKRLQSLSELLFARFRHTRSMDDLDRTIQLREQALVLTSSTDTDWVVQAHNLGNCYGERFDMNGHIDDLNRSIMLLEAAARRQDMQLEGDTLCSLAFRLVGRSDRTGSMDDLNSAVAAGERSTNLSVQGHDRTERITCLAACLSRRFERAGSMKDLDRAVQLLRNAVSLMPTDYPHRGQTLNNLGATLGLKHGMTKSAADLDDAIEATGKALEALPSDHPLRVLALMKSSYHAWTSRERPSMLRTAVELLPLLSPKSLQHLDKQHELKHFQGLSSRAASAALNANLGPVHALQLLESGRDIISTMTMEVRTDVSLLEQQHPDLAKEFCRLRDVFDTPDGMAGVSGTWSNRNQGNLGSASRMKADRGLQDVLRKIRLCQGFERFPLPPTEDEIKAAANPDPIVVINATAHRSDAILITKNHIRLLELPDLKAIEILTLFLETRQPDTREYRSPVTNDNWPVMSSYATSVKQLIRGLGSQNRQSAGPPSNKALVIGMSDTPGFGQSGSLPFAATEVAMVERVCSPLKMHQLTFPGQSFAEPAC